MSDRMVQHRLTDTFPRSYERVLAEVNVGDPQAVDPSSYPSMLPKDLDRIDCESGRHRDIYAATREPSSLEALITCLRTTITTCEENKRRRSRLLYELGCALVEQSKGSNAESTSVISEAIDSFQEALSLNGIPESLSCRAPIVVCLIDATSMTLELSRHQPGNLRDHYERPHERMLAEVNVSGPQAPGPLSYPSMLPRDIHSIDSESGRHRDVFAATRDPSTLEMLITSLRSAITSCEENGARRSRLLYELGFALLEQFKLCNARSAVSEAIKTFQEALCFNGIPESLSRRVPIIFTIVEATSMALSQHQSSIPRDSDWGDYFDFLANFGIRPGTDSFCRFHQGSGEIFLVALRSLTKYESDLDETISHLRSAIDVCQDIVDVETCSLLFAGLGDSLYWKFKETKDIDALEESIAMLRKALNLRSSGDQTRLVSRFFLPERWRMRLQADGFTDCFFWQSTLCKALNARFDLRGEESDLNELIERERSLIDTQPDKLRNTTRSMSYSILAKDLRLRFDRTGECEALDEAIEMTRKALELQSMEDQNHSTSLQLYWDDSNKGIEAQGFTRSATERSEVTDNEALKESIEMHRNPSEFQPSSVKRHAYLLRFHAQSLFERFEQRKNAQDSTDAIRFYKEALDALPSDDPNRCAILEVLSEIHMSRYEVDGEMQDLNEATALVKLAEDTCPIDSERRAGVSTSKALILLHRYDLDQDEKYLDEAMLLLEQVLDTLPPTYSRRHIILQRLSRCLEEKFQSSGDVTYLDKALYMARELNQNISPNVTIRRSNLGYIASLLSMRYEQTGNEQDLDDAITFYSNCLQLTPLGHPSRYARLSNLGSVKSKKHMRSGDAHDLIEVVKLYREALQCCPKDNTARGFALGNLATALGFAYRHSKSLADLDEVITMFKEALGLLPPNHTRRLTNLLNYAMLCKDGYFEHGRNEDLQEALDRFHEFESSLLDYHPWKCRLRVGIAELYFRSHNQTEDSIRKAVLLFRSAVQHFTASAEVRFFAALRWVNSARKIRHGSIIEAYGYAMNLLERRLLANPTAELQHQLLAKLPKSFASDAAASAMGVGDIEAAVGLLEQGRGLLWTQLSRYKHPLDALEKANPDLAEKFRTVNRRLERLALSSSRGASSTQFDIRIHTPLDKQMEDLHSLSKEWDEVVEQIRRLDGFSDFLRAVPFAKLQKAAADGPIIIVNVSRYRCDAILIRDGESPVVVPLPELSLEKLVDAYMSLLECFKILHGSGVRLDLAEVWNKIVVSAKKWFMTISEPSNIKQKFTPYAGIENILRYLWSSIVSPVVSKLNELSIKPQSRIWWCPTSVLCHLPLHAAGPYEDGMPNLPDLFISSYLLSLSNSDALRRAQPDIPVPTPRTPKALVIGCPGEENFLDNIEDEIIQIADSWLTNNHNALTILVGEDANHDEVLSRLPHHPWVHFTCHGNQGEKPLESSFLLHGNKRLTLLDLMGADAKNAELAYLSACNTATGDVYGTSDEALHLAAAMQHCGFRSVVGTLWPMADIDGPDVARDFYGYLLNEGKGDYRSSAAALHHAVQQMRKRKVPIDRWINFVHFGA